MDEKLYADLLNRLAAVSETILDCLVLEGALSAILVTKGVCTLEEIEFVKDMVRDMDHVQKAQAAIDSLREDIKNHANLEDYHG